MNNWQTKKLGDILELCDSGTWGKESSEGMPLLRSSNMQNGQLILDDLKLIDVPTKLKDRYTLNEGDILMTKSSGGETHIGKSLYIDSRIDGLYGFSNFTQRLRPNKKLVLPLFLYFLISSPAIRKKLLNSSRTTSGLRNLSIPILKSFEIPFPPISVQRMIVEKLDAIRKLQELNQKEIKKAEELFDAFFNSTFIPTNEWSTKKISDVAMVNPPKPKFHEWDLEKEVDFLPMSALATDAQNPLLTGKRKLKQVKTGYTCFQSDDILLAKITPCFENGKTGIFRKSPDSIGFGSTEFIVIRADNKKVVPIWIWLFVFSNRFRREGKLHMTGSAGQKRLPVSFVEKYHIPIPPLNVQQQIVEKFQSIGKYYELSKRKKESLNELFESTLNKVMKGELVN